MSNSLQESVLRNETVGSFLADYATVSNEISMFKQLQWGSGLWKFFKKKRKICNFICLWTEKSTLQRFRLNTMIMVLMNKWSAFSKSLKKKSKNTKFKNQIKAPETRLYNEEYIEMYNRVRKELEEIFYEKV